MACLLQVKDRARGLSFLQLLGPSTASFGEWLIKKIREWGQAPEQACHGSLQLDIQCRARVKRVAVATPTLGTSWHRQEPKCDARLG